MKQQFSIKIGGESGQGVKSAGFIITKALKDIGYWIFSYSEYPSLIKGGHSTFQVNVDTKQIRSATTFYNVLVALNAETIALDIEKLEDGGFLLCDEKFLIPNKVKKLIKDDQINLIKVPIGNILAKHNAPPIMENTVIMGVLWGLISASFAPLDKRIKQVFELKGKDTTTNSKCAQEGFKFTKTLEVDGFDLKALRSTNRIVGTGNEVAGLSLFASGCRMFAAYPMTPATGILHYLAPRASKFGMVVKQAEDEMTAVQMVIGANYAGTRAACATSGGGLALMAESISLSGMTETPLVIINSQRPAPATGLPTWTEQGDLDFVSKIGHGDFPRVILAPGDIEEIFGLMPKAFNLAERFQIPVIFLLDKYLSESWFQTEKFRDASIKVERGQIVTAKELLRELEFKRYKSTTSGISSRSLPGMKNGIFLANSDEHDEKGYSSENELNRKTMMEKRMRKLSGIYSILPEPKLYGPKEAKTTIICWGSTKGPVMDALPVINATKTKVNMLHFSYLYPLKASMLGEIAKRNKFISIENNFSSQFAKLIRQEAGITIELRITKYSGNQFFKDELIEILNKKIR